MNLGNLAVLDEGIDSIPLANDVEEKELVSAGDLLLCMTTSNGDGVRFTKVLTSSGHSGWIKTAYLKAVYTYVLGTL